MERVWILTNYNTDPSGVISKLTDPYYVYNHGDVSVLPEWLVRSSAFYQKKNTGHNLSDYLEFIIENYSQLPESLGFAKGNIFPRHISESEFSLRILEKGFVPLYADPKTYKVGYSRFVLPGMISQQISPGYYLEKTNNWYAKQRKKGRYFPHLHDMYKHYFNRVPPKYIPFVPGACMIVPSYKIMRWSLDVYKELLEAVTYEYFPVEAFHLERCMLYFFDYPVS